MRTGKKLFFDNFWKYALVVVAVVFVWSAVYENLSQIKLNQRVTVAVYNLECDTQALRDEVWDKLPELTKQEVLELYVDDLDHVPNQTYAEDILLAQILQSDLVVMPESLLKAIEVSVYFQELPKNLQRENGYQSNGKQYGICIPANSRFSAYYTGDERCYIFFNASSVNLGGLFEKGTTEDDAALQVFEYLLEE